MADMQAKPRATGSRLSSPSRQSKASSSTSSPATVAMARYWSGSWWAKKVSAAPAVSAMVRRSLPLPDTWICPRGRRAMCSVRARRRLVAMRKAARWEHISPAMYSRTDSTAKPTARQPQGTMWMAAAKSGAVSSTSFKMRQMYQNGTSATRALTADRTQER